jgi:hypothetical protein
MLRRLARACGALASAALPVALSGCGDVSVVRLDVNFADPALEVETRAIRVITRTLPPNPAAACVDFERDEPPPGVLSGESVVAYPLEDPVQASNIDLTLYPTLTFIVLAYPTVEIEGAQAIAGACDNIDIDTDGRIPVRVILEAL